MKLNRSTIERLPLPEPGKRVDYRRMARGENINEKHREAEVAGVTLRQGAGDRPASENFGQMCA